MDFKTLLAAIAAEETMPENWGEQLTEAYELDLSIPGAKVDDLVTQLEAKDAEIAALKIRNYELLEYGAANDTETVDELEDELDNDDENITTDDLFGEEGDED